MVTVTVTCPGCPKLDPKMSSLMVEISSLLCLSNPTFWASSTVGSIQKVSENGESPRFYTEATNRDYQHISGMGACKP